jgi:FtsP/CotA-like multicopper oxidase with cupredoxin domain
MSRKAFSYGRLKVSSLVLAIAVVFSVSTVGAQTTAPTHLGRGVVPAWDMAKMASQATSGSDAADQVCPRSAAGSTVTAPPELKSSGGTFEATLNFQTVNDAQGLVRYCFVTSPSLQSPTLRVNPGDTLIIHFNNNLPVTAASSACNGVMSADASNIHFYGTNVAPVCGQDEVVQTLVSPGRSFAYKVQIPTNEPPGLYWYHPHGDSHRSRYAEGHYNVVVTGTAGSGTSQSQVSASVPITID